MRIRLCKGYHSSFLRDLVRETWVRDDLLIVCPPHLQQTSFIRYLPEGEIEWLGEWKQDSRFVHPRVQARYPAQPVLGVFTSGTVTGEPRLVLYSKENIEASLGAILELFDRSRIKMLFSYAQPFHTFGLLLGYVLAMKLECELVTPDGKYSAKSHAKRLALSEPGLITLGTPAHFYDLVDLVTKQGRVIEPSYSCIIGGAGVSRALWQQAQQVLKIEQPSIGYGCTEASPGITHLPPGHEPIENNEIGFPLKSIRSTLRSSEVVIGGPALCLGVIDQSGIDFSLSRVVRDELRSRADGVWVFEGRSDLMINRGGEKFSLELIENRLHTDLNLNVIGVPVIDQRLGQDIGLLVKVAPEDSRDSILETLQSYFHEQFHVRLRPSLCRFTSVFPLSPSSKPSRREAAEFVSTVVPVPTSALFEWLPHRPPMVWIDQVVSFDETGGEAKVCLKEDGHYMTNGLLRPSTLIEFIAQAFGYISICQNREALSAGRPAIKKAFLAGVRDAKLEKVTGKNLLKPGTVLVIRIGGIKSFGPLRAIDGIVYSEKGEQLASAKLKVYSSDGDD